MNYETLFTMSADGRLVDVEQWKSYLGLSPTEFCRYGDNIPTKNSRCISMSSYWTYGILRSEYDSVDLQVSLLLDQLIPIADKIVALKKKYNLEVGMSSFAWVGEGDLSDLDLFISAENISKISMLLSDFSIRVYDQ
ncbi:DUF4279 domain-containing protein [Gilvimarinus polysaccharolyticus]|uniref:DUF4279 domain-containing protein n=1 Tax=Gilvimarinus polysaccharolyticus TaxID=863921 RepID=UPI000673A2BE|nr:DUF4279 domain-containing protein [Gilvimarinus polysaccharolyticus]